jgi:hypothetical protein
MFLKKFNKMISDQELEKWNKLNDDFNLWMKKLPSEF